ncbi:hypothetical protein G6F43_012107 [Rhizopus delemar]|nr:hypothetical protein G6F43_012107 [Rhizopus delemar]
MNNINDLTQEQIQETLELSRRLKEQDLKNHSIEDQSLPTEILDDLEYSPKNTLKTKLKQFAKETNKYEGGKWTQSGMVNKIYLPELKKYQVDANQTITAFTKGANRLRTAGRAATDIYQEFYHVIENGGSEEEMYHILEKIRRLAVYSFGTGKDLATKALRLPESLKYLEDEDEDEDGKDYFFSPDIVEKIQQTRFEETVIKGATQLKFGGFTHYSIPEDGIPPGSRLQHFIGNWKKMTTQTWPLSVIEDGYKIQFNSKPIPWTTKAYKLSESDQQAVNKAVDSFLKSKVIERSPTQDKRFLSQFFTIKEPNKIRPILDCRKINRFIQCNHFKMEGVPALRDIVEKEDFLTKIDLKDAYIVVPIHLESRKFLSFSHKGTIYQHRSLAFGLSVAPRLFSKLMRHALESLRAIGIRLVF